MSTSLNKFISETGICSRREADKWIEAGRLKINGTAAVKGNRVEDGDIVLLDGKPLTHRPPAVYLAFNKPPGVTSTTDQKDPTNIIDYIGYPERIFPIGRLDKFSTGLIILTNDGDIVNPVLRVENSHEKEYQVRVDKPISRDFIRHMADGVPILDTITKRCEVRQESSHTFTIILTQGLNRQIRRMCEYLGYHPITLHRVRIMHITLGNLRPGRWRRLTDKEIGRLVDKS